MPILSPISINEFTSKNVYTGSMSEDQEDSQGSGMTDRYGKKITYIPSTYPTSPVIVTSLNELDCHSKKQTQSNWTVMAKNCLCGFYRRNSEPSHSEAGNTEASMCAAGKCQHKVAFLPHCRMEQMLKQNHYQKKQFPIGMSLIRTNACRIIVYKIV